MLSYSANIDRFCFDLCHALVRVLHSTFLDTPRLHSFDSPLDPHISPATPSRVGRALQYTFIICRRVYAYRITHAKSRRRTSSFYPKPALFPRHVHTCDCLLFVLLISRLAVARPRRGPEFHPQSPCLVLSPQRTTQRC